MKRLFIAIKISSSKNLEEIVSEIRKTEKAINWVNLSQLHLTLAFLGDTDEKKIPDLKNCISSFEKFSSFELKHHGLGTFGNKISPHVLWMGLKRSSQLLKIHSELNSQLEALGFTMEKRIFVPHITLGRIKRIQYIQSFQNIINANDQQDFGKSMVNKLILFESTLTPQGPIYKEIFVADFRL